MTEFADRSVKKGGPALLFEKPKGSRIPVLLNAFASMRRMEIALDVKSVEEIAARIVEFLESISSTKNPTPEQAEKEFFEKHRSSSLLQRLIESEEIANLVAFLASPLSSATNGSALRAEGGLLRQQKLLSFIE